MLVRDRSELDWHFGEGGLVLRSLGGVGSSVHISICGLLRRHTREAETQFALYVTARFETILPIRRQTFRLRRYRTAVRPRRVRDDCFNCSAHIFPFIIDHDGTLLPDPEFYPLDKKPERQE